MNSTTLSNTKKNCNAQCIVRDLSRNFQDKAKSGYKKTGITCPHEHSRSEQYNISKIITPLLLPETCKPKKNQKERIKELEAQLEYAKRLTINLITSNYNQLTTFLQSIEAGMLTEAEKNLSFCIR